MNILLEGIWYSFDVIVIERNFRKSKWLLTNAYKAPSVNNSLFCDQIARLLDFYSPTYKNIVLMGHFNMRVTDNNFQAFYESHYLCNLIKEKTCFKSMYRSNINKPEIFIQEFMYDRNWCK